MNIRLLIATAAIAVAGICSAAPAHADQDGYLKMLADDGFPMTHDNFASMFQLGYAVCATMHTSDLSEQQAVSRILRDTPRRQFSEDTTSCRGGTLAVVPRRQR
jgi:Protein of unknown function (DUF732)